jgi:hypothetical protein
MNDRYKELVKQAVLTASATYANGPDSIWLKEYNQKFAELMVVEFMDVVKSTANELNEHYFKQGCSEEEVLMRVNGALAVLGHIRERFKD